jgi:hypothetical protein
MSEARDRALLWLNDRLGKSVHASVKLDKGDYSVTLLAAEGELQHWRADTRVSSAWRGHLRDDVAGLYDVGGASVDLTDIGGSELRIRDDGEIHSLAIDLAEDISLEIVEIGSASV